MPRRRKQKDPVDQFFGLVGPISALIILLGLVFGFKWLQAMVGLATLTLYAILALLGIALIGHGIYVLNRGRADRADESTIEIEPVHLSQEPDQPRPKKPAPPQDDSRYMPKAVVVDPEPTPTRSKPFDWAETVDGLDWYQFEKLVGLAFEQQGWTVERRGGANADGGIDLVLRKPGEDDTAVQCKHWKAWNLGVSRVRDFLGAITHARMKRGILIASKGYTEASAQLAGEHDIRLMNQVELVKMLEETGCRYAPGVQDLLNDRTKYCPKCEAPMVLRTGTTQFWGCSKFPRCRYKMNA